MKKPKEGRMKESDTVTIEKGAKALVKKSVGKFGVTEVVLTIFAVLQVGPTAQKMGQTAAPAVVAENKSEETRIQRVEVKLDKLNDKVDDLRDRVSVLQGRLERTMNLAPDTAKGAEQLVKH